MLQDKTAQNSLQQGCFVPPVSSVLKNQTEKLNK